MRPENQVTKVHVDRREVAVSLEDQASPDYRGRRELQEVKDLLAKLAFQDPPVQVVMTE